MHWHWTTMLCRLKGPPLRLFHLSAPRAHLVGPPDPVSNLRPVIYHDVAPARAETTHPYLLNEFGQDTREYQWKMQRQDLDAYNNAYWTDSNTRFEAAKSAVLQSLPPTASAADREFALSDFYKGWVSQERVHQDEYNAQWRRRNWTSVLLAARLEYEKFMSLNSHPLSSNNNK